MIPKFQMFSLNFMSWLAIAGYFEVRHRMKSQSESSELSAQDNTSLLSWLSIERSYLIVYWLMMGGDWLQGPYEYKMYQKLGYDHTWISMFFVTGFSSSGLMGTFVGSLADSIGRKKMALAYAFFYSIACISKLGYTPALGFILLGRVAGGIATSLLYSVFESWIVTEHSTSKCDDGLLSKTMATATFGNGIVAVCTGLYSSTMISAFPGENEDRIPFFTALFCLASGSIVILFRWRENYGSSSLSSVSSDTYTEKFSRALKAMITPQLAIMTFIQTLFETCMYTWIVLWVPTIHSLFGTDGIPYGVLFASFMLSFMTGSRVFGVVFGYFSQAYPRFQALTSTLSTQLRLGSIGLLICFISTFPNGGLFSVGLNQFLLLVGFGLFEVACGLYWPSLGSIRAVIVPSSIRSTVMNIARVPLNVCVALMLYSSGAISTHLIYFGAGILLTVASFLAQNLQAGEPELPITKPE